MQFLVRLCRDKRIEGGAIERLMVTGIPVRAWENSGIVANSEFIGEEHGVRDREEAPAKGNFLTSSKASTSGGNQAISVKLKDPRYMHPHSIHMNTITGASTFGTGPEINRGSRMQNMQITAERSLTSLNKKGLIQSPQKVDMHKPQLMADALFVKGVELGVPKDGPSVPVPSVAPSVTTATGTRPKGGPQMYENLR